MCGNSQAFSLIFTGIFFFVVVVVPHLAYSCLPKSNCWGVSVSLKLHKQTVGQKPSVHHSCGGGFGLAVVGWKEKPKLNRSPNPLPSQVGTQSHTALCRHHPFAPSPGMRCTMEPGSSLGLPSNAVAFCHCKHCFPLELRNKTQTFQSPDSSSSWLLQFAVFQ